MLTTKGWSIAEFLPFFPREFRDANITPIISKLNTKLTVSMYSNNFSRIDNVHLSALISRRNFRAFIAKQDQKKKDRSEY